MEVLKNNGTKWFVETVWVGQAEHMVHFFLSALVQFLAESRRPSCEAVLVVKSR